MLKALGIFIRLVCSLVVLLAAALYLQMPAAQLGSALSPDTFCDAVSLDALMSFFTSLNWVSITAGVLVFCALLRLLDMAWNVAFCLSIIPVLFCGLWAVWGPAVALPAPLQGNEYMTQLCTLPQDYPVPALIVAGIFAMGWLASTAPFRIAFTTLVSFGLWYGITCLMHWGIVTRWADTPTPAQPEVLAMVLANPWVIAALPGAFFLVYSVLAAFFETFLAVSRKKAAAKKAEEKKPEPLPVSKPVTKVLKPIAKPTAKPAAAPAPLPAVPKAEPNPAPKAPAAPAPKPEPKPEEKPAPEPKAEAKTEATPAPKAEEKPAAPTPEAKPADAKEEKPAPQAEEKPADKA